MLALTGACVYGSCSVLLSIIMSSLFNLPGLHQCSTHVAVSGRERAHGCHHAEGQANPAQHEVARVLLQDMSMVEDAEDQNWKGGQGQCDTALLKWEICCRETHT